MRRVRSLTLAVLCAASITAGAASAQPASRPARIGWLSPLSAPPPRTPALDVLRSALAELGWVEGRNFTFEFRWGGDRLEGLAAAAQGLVRLPVDLIIAPGGPVTLVAKRATSTIPIVMLWSYDPVDLGLVASLARPGGNVTGLSFQSLDILGKQLQLFKELLPQAKRFAVLIAWDVPRGQWMDEPAATLGIGIHRVRWATEAELDAGFEAIARAGDDGVVIGLGAASFARHRARILELARRHRLPTMYPGGRELVDEGALMSYGPNFSELYRRAASYVDKILKGAKPADLPVEQPTRFELVLNLKTAQTLGLTIPQSILARTDELIR